MSWRGSGKERMQMETVIKNTWLRCGAAALLVSLICHLSDAGVSADTVASEKPATSDPSSETRRAQTAADFQLLFEEDSRPEPQAEAETVPAWAPVMAAKRARRPSQRQPANRNVAERDPRQLVRTQKQEEAVSKMETPGAERALPAVEPSLPRGVSPSPPAIEKSPSSPTDAATDRNTDVVFGPPRAPSNVVPGSEPVPRQPRVTMAERKPVAEAFTPVLAPMRAQLAWAEDSPQVSVAQQKAVTPLESFVPVTAATRQPAAVEPPHVEILARHTGENTQQSEWAGQSPEAASPNPLPSTLMEGKPAQIPTYEVAFENPPVQPIQVAAEPGSLAEGPGEAGSAEAQTVAFAPAMPPNHLHGSANCPPCDTIGPQSPCPVNGFHCIGCGKCRALQSKLDWHHAGPIPWEAFGHGEYIGPARVADVPEYRLRVDDILDFVFRLTRDVLSEPYRLEVGDVIEVQSLTSPEQNKQVEIQSDGTVSLGVLGQVSAAGRTIAEFRAYLNDAFSEFIKNPGITVTPVDTQTKLDELIATVDNRFGRGGQARPARVTPEGTVQLPAIGSVPAQGLTLDELKREIDARYAQIVAGLEVTPILQERAPTYVFVVGEVGAPGRFTLEGPTTVMQSIALAGSWNIGADLRHVIVFRRDYNWNLMATRLDIRGALYGRKPCPADEIWLRDSDIVVVPKHPIRELDDAIELLFTRGAYSVFPIRWTYQLSDFTRIADPLVP